MARQADSAAAEVLKVRRLGLVDYQPTWRAMREFTENRQPDTADEFWLLQHPPVFTLGHAGREKHLLAPGDIPVVRVDRGGQVTYHGPGQLLVYLLVDIRRRGLGVRKLVGLIESALIDALAAWGIDAQLRPDAPGVYVAGAKIASLGLRIRRGRSFHGLALNVDLDLEPFRRINPCGEAGLAVTQLSQLLGAEAMVSFTDVETALLQRLSRGLGYTRWEYVGTELQ